MAYVEHMVKIMEKVKRVLKPNDSHQLNMADYTRTEANALIQVPEMTSITLQQNGWHLMSTLIWLRRDAKIPKRRFVRDWKYLYWFTKSTDYYFNEDCVFNKTSVFDYPFIEPKRYSFVPGYPVELRHTRRSQTRLRKLIILAFNSLSISLYDCSIRFA